LRRIYLTPTTFGLTKKQVAREWNRAISGEQNPRSFAMLPNRFRITSRATRALGNLKAATGLTPNILCRYAFAHSIKDGKNGGLKELVLDGSEFNMPTLFGEHAAAYECVLRQLHGEMPAKRVVEVIASHIEDGIDLLRGYAPIQALSLGTSRRADKFETLAAASDVQLDPK
jgi:DNA sulfur modification protein DndE